jgi:hypothetical protein
MMRKQHLRREFNSIEQQYNLLVQKVDRLRTDLAIETDTLRKFQLEQQLERERPALDRLEQQLEAIERLLAAKVVDNLPTTGQRAVRRVREHVRVLDALAGSALVVVFGIGGTGKTWLALDVGRALAEQYDSLPRELQFEAIIWLSTQHSPPLGRALNGLPAAARTVADLCDEIARVLHFAAILPADPAQKVAPVREALAQQRTLLIVDGLDAQDDAEVLDFVRTLPRATRVLVTAHQHLGAAYHVRLDGMPWDEARLLIDQECGLRSIRLADGDQQILYDQTAGHPLSLIWCVEGLAAGIDLKTITAELANPQGQIAYHSLEIAFSRIRGSGAHQLLMALALLNARCSPEILSSIAGIEHIAERNQAVATLEQFALIQREGDACLIMLLIRQYALKDLMNSPDQQFAAMVERTLVVQQLLNNVSDTNVGGTHLPANSDAEKQPPCIGQEHQAASPPQQTYASTSRGTHEPPSFLGTPPRHIRRCADLTESIHSVLNLIKQYEDVRLLADDPKAKLRAERSIADLRTQLAAYKREQRDLGCVEPNQ